MVRSPTVSVVLPVLNGEPYLSACIDSILTQSHRDCEVLIVDDGSTDRSRAIAEEFARAHPERIRILTHPRGRHVGISASRNLGVLRSRGKYVAFQDADDVWEDDKLSSQVDVLQRHPEIGLVFSGYRTLKDDRIELAPHPTEVPSEKRDRPMSMTDFLVENNFIATPTTMAPRDVLLRAGLFDTALRTEAEDWQMWIKIASRHSLYYIARPLATVRVHRGNTSSRSFDRGLAFMDEYLCQVRLGTFWRQCPPNSMAGSWERALTKTLQQRACMLSMESDSIHAHWRGAMGLMRFGALSLKRRLTWSVWARLVIRLSPAGGRSFSKRPSR